MLFSFTALLTILGAYVSTTVDDLLMLTLLYTQADDMLHRKRILQGQCLGIGVLVALSLLSAAGLQLLPSWVIGILGIIPIYLGVREALSANTKEEKTPARAISLFGVALLAIANGADNIGVYAPLFAGFALSQKILAVLLFAVMTVAWCALAALLSAQPQLRTVLQKYRRILVPVILILLGLYILLSNLLTLLL